MISDKDDDESSNINKFEKEQREQLPVIRNAPYTLDGDPYPCPGRIIVTYDTSNDLTLDNFRVIYIALEPLISHHLEANKFPD